MNGVLKLRLFGFALVMLSCCFLSTNVYALHFDLGNGNKLDWDTTVRYTLAERVAKQNPVLLANPNADDGDRNFDRGSLIKNRFDLLTEADLNLGKTGFMDNFGLFTRARAWYDDVYNRKNDNNSPLTNNNISAPYNEFTNATEVWQGRQAEMLDYFLYSSFDAAGHDTSVRIGQQALNWGETLFLVGGVMSSQGPIDATGFNQPGVELKELFLPVKQVDVQTSFSDNLTAEAYYQFQWEPYRLDAAGSYFSTNDVIDEGGESFILIPGLFSATRSADEDAKNSGQWGAALRYFAENLNGTEFGLYFVNYHDHLPMLVAGDFVDLTGDGIPDAPSTYHLKYAENIHLYAASFGTVVGDANISGEVAYRKNVPVQLKGALPSYRREGLVHYSLSGIYLFPPNSFTDGINLTAEVAADQMLDHKEDVLNDAFAWGYSFTLKPTWKSVLPGWDVSLPISLNQGVKGDSPLAASFVEGKSKLGVTLDLLYAEKYDTQLGYVCFFGGAGDNNQDDRDYVSMNFKYTF